MPRDAYHSQTEAPPHLLHYEWGSFKLCNRNHTYLGVELNNKLNWADHVNNTATKANKVLGLLRRNLYSCPQKVKETSIQNLGASKIGILRLGVGPI